MTVILAALPPAGGYVSLVKVVFMLVLIIPWLMIVPWVYQDVARVRGSQGQWSMTIIFTGLIGVLVWLFLPMYLIGLSVYLVLFVGVVTGYVFWRDARVGPGDKLISVIRARGFMLSGKGVTVDVLERVKIYDDRNVLIPPPDPGTASIPECETYNSVQQFLVNMLTRRASEADISPGSQTEAVVRFIVDGVLNVQPSLSLSESDMLIQAIKPMAGLDPEERRRPQDGMMSLDFAGNQVEIGVVTTGSTGGQRMQFRAMHESIRTNIQELGMTGAIFESVKAMTNRNSGLIIVSGRIGSGVTSTLYSLLRSMDAYTKSLVTLEAKTAADMENVTQTVYGDPKHLPKALTAAIRSDPDVIMVDACPDSKTAELIANASADKLVLMGIGAIDTFTALALWLKACGSEIDAMANLRGVLCQALIRNLCPACRQPYRPDPQMLAKANLASSQIERFYRAPDAGRVDEDGEPVICPSCQETGYIGRTGVFELLEISDEIRGLISDKAQLAQIKAACRKNDMHYLQENALQKVMDGMTSIQEVIRVTQQGKKKKKK
ncbi:MAG: ATPase, T2SS/T4P/T4SS family [Phycisphaerae bacterium]|jgi:type II secretory ATPase GspE/PulE/Tfp pilus assembly ATPase PilB-like protein|nr:ATPase, T2SS/T4P/T4SS family [Phycisphaerae bacterium]